MTVGMCTKADSTALLISYILGLFVILVCPPRILESIGSRGGYATFHHHYGVLFMASRSVSSKYRN